MKNKQSFLWLFLVFLILSLNLARAQTGRSFLDLTQNMSPVQTDWMEDSTTLLPLAPKEPEPAALPSRTDLLQLQDLSPIQDIRLFGLHNMQTLEFSLRKDQVVESADLNLVFTPSPALLPRLSHLRVYLNDELMGVVVIEEEFAGQQLSRKIALNPLLMTSFNRLRLEFVGHYTDICEDLSHTSLWLDISQKTSVRINQSMLSLANDLSYFPEPFFDEGDMQTQTIPFVFATAPSHKQIQAAGILSSYFGVHARWRELEHPVYFDQLPENHAVVLATNEHRPDFLKDYPEVTAPTVELMSMPGQPHYKLLLIMGVTDEDLIQAASALAVGNPVFRGRSVTIDKLQEIAPRKPYDAPYWTPTNRPVFFSELMGYPGQLDTEGLFPRPIDLDINLPPDLFVWRNSGIPMQLLYHYTAPNSVDQASLVVSLNNQFIEGYKLNAEQSQGYLERLRLPLMGEEELRAKEHVLRPALHIGASNRLRFDFSFAAIVGSAQRDTCQTLLPPDIRASINPNSMIDFSGFHHFLAMPNLRAFAGSGYPFSRMADLSETVVVLPEQPNQTQIATFLEAIGDIGGQIGYPALKARLSSDLETAKQLDADILFIGEMPAAMRERPDANLLLQDTQAVLSQPRAASSKVQRSNNDYQRQPLSEHDTTLKAAVRSVAPMAAIVGLQSETHPERSVVGLLASSEQDYALLRDALASSGKRAVMEGSVVIIRESGVYAEMVGPVYYVGHLPWWERLWYTLSDRPIWLGGLAFILVLLIAILLWNVFRLVARKRLEHDD